MGGYKTNKIFPFLILSIENLIMNTVIWKPVIFRKLKFVTVNNSKRGEKVLQQHFATRGGGSILSLSRYLAKNISKIVKPRTMEFTKI